MTERQQQLVQNVEKHRQMILDAERWLWAHPQTGYTEWEAHNYLVEKYEALGYSLTLAGNIPGFYTEVDTGRPGPKLAIFGELDALDIANHPESVNGMAHCCGHNGQSAALLGIAAALKEPGALDGLCGTIRLVAVPAEEMIQLAFREDLRKKGVIQYMGGKVEFMARGMLDGVDIDRQRFYERLVESDVLPTTSQPSPDAFAQLFDQVEAAGDSAVVLTISHKLSGTYQSACIAAEGRERIFVVDTMSASIGSGILARYAIDNAHLHAGELAALLERRRQDVCIIGLVDTLEYLKKGGRISKTAAFAGGLLNIHPVLTLTDGEVTIIGKARGSRQGNNLLVQKIHESGGIDFSMPLLLGYSGLSDALLQKYVADSAPLWENGTETLESVCIGSVIGTHAGPGAVVAAFFRRGGK